MYIVTFMINKILSFLYDDPKYNFLIIFVCLIALSVSFYFEYYLGVAPCILCVAQRTLFSIMLAVFLLRNIFSIQTKYFLLLPLFFGFLGLIASGRQIYLQSTMTDQVLSCGPKFFDLFVNLPFTEFISRIFQADSSCSQPVYMIIGFQISEWSAAIFLFFIFLIFFKFFYQFKN
ncbi:MAG: hypothetical protein CMN79_03765 [Spirochaetales bacterium]|nr:hypothetical protein [Spirochaetales bacterium]